MRRVFAAFLAVMMLWLSCGCAATTEQTSATVKPPSTTTTTTITTTVTTTTTIRQIAATTTQRYRDCVYVTPYGKKYHYSRSCAGKNATPTERETAALYFTPCKKCAGG